ncbi:MAG: OmpA family protein [Thiomicrospira sp.]|nr:OmpA family protein [Thiomicrospira sp.]NCO14758.1 OmpA family protein [Thiomicrospira sp.]NCO82355.1 OmpA family protein [Thiomicrospira sp.]OIP95178.1 MAG: hypothetical protein AUK56_06485 [Thiomicrospira sp. CG2_30_44_34]
MEGVIIAALVGALFFSSTNEQEARAFDPFPAPVETTHISQVKAQWVKANTTQEPTIKTAYSVGRIKKLVLKKMCITNSRIKLRFDLDSTKINQPHLIKEYANLVKKCKSTSLVITGFASPVGSRKYNIKLAERRAKAVKMALGKELENVNMEILNPLDGSEIKDRSVTITFVPGQEMRI